MKKQILGLAIAALALTSVTPINADNRSYTERECSTDSYGNTTCRDKTVNVETGVITYSNQRVTGVIDSSVIGSGRSYGRGIAILNTGFPDVPSVVAGITIGVGGLSYLVQKLRRRAK